MTNYKELIDREYAVISHLSTSIVVESEDLIPEFSRDGDAGADLRSKEDYVIEVGQQILVKTGVKIELPKGFVALVCSRSGLALRNGVFVLNAPGIVDSGYRGEVGVILKNAGDQPFEIKRGDAGFGSTGKE